MFNASLSHSLAGDEGDELGHALLRELLCVLGNLGCGTRMRGGFCSYGPGHKRGKEGTAYDLKFNVYLVAFQRGRARIEGRSEGDNAG